MCFSLSRKAIGWCHCMSLGANGMSRLSGCRWLPGNMHDEYAVSVVRIGQENRNDAIFFGNRFWRRLPILLAVQTARRSPGSSRRFFNVCGASSANDGTCGIPHAWCEAECKHAGLFNRAHIGSHAEVGNHDRTVIGNSTYPVAGAGGRRCQQGDDAQGPRRTHGGSRRTREGWEGRRYVTGLSEWHGDPE